MTAQSAIDRAYAKGIRGMEVAGRVKETLAQALALTLTMAQMLTILAEFATEPEETQ